MNIPLTVRKLALSFVIVLLVAGNVARLASLSEITEPVLASESNVYAADLYEPLNSVRPKIDYTFEQVNRNGIEKKVEYIDVDPEHIRKVEAYLASRGAPLAAEADTFVLMAFKYGLPYNLMPAISIIESSGGRHNYRPYNYAGMGGQGAALSFTSYDQAIEKHAQILKKGYFDKGATTPEAIGQYYCYQCPTWGSKVRAIMNKIEAM